MSVPIPSQARKIVIRKLSADFREATRIEDFEVPTSLKPGEILIRNSYAGINASDVNFTAGKYTPGLKPPFDAGFESIGVVAQAGSGVKGIKVGDAVAFTGYGAFAEYKVCEASRVVPMPSAQAQFLPLLVSGLTASLALEQTGEIKQVGVNGAKKEVVVVTAAAGGTGVFAVQLAKLAGHHVVATCSSDDKVEFLKGLGADRVINYKKEDFGTVLKTEYPKGVDVVYESVGGSMFNECVKNLAVKGRLIVIGFVSGYQDGSGWKSVGDKPSDPRMKSLPAMILGKSASIRGFFLNDFTPLFRRHMQQMTQLIADGKLKSIVDPTTFVGLEEVPKAIDFLYKGGNVGKIVVDIRQQSKPQQIRSAL